MLTYIARRLLWMIPLLLGISIINFTIMKLAPGDPVSVLVGRNATPDQRERIRVVYGLDQPLHIQYLKWLGQILKGDLGRSFVDGRPVKDHILERLPYTLYLNFFIMILIYVVSIPIGIISALKQYSKFDHSVTFVAFLGQAVPSFWIALLLIYAIVHWNIPYIPITGAATIGVSLKTDSLFVVLLDRAKYMLLPMLVIAFSDMAGTTRYMRSSMLEVIRQDYVRTARAKGLPEKVVIMKHALRNALLPIVTLLGFELQLLFSGSVIIEQIFSWPGLGMLGIRAIWQRDYQIVMALNMIAAVLMVIGNLLSDLLYAVVDPRIKYS